jgi:hypothetical protein
MNGTFLRKANAAVEVELGHAPPRWLQMLSEPQVRQIIQIVRDVANGYHLARRIPWTMSSIRNCKPCQAGRHLVALCYVEIGDMRLLIGGGNPL